MLIFGIVKIFILSFEQKMIEDNFIDDTVERKFNAEQYHLLFYDILIMICDLTLCDTSKNV